MLILCLPKEYRDEARLRKLYGDSARRIFVPRTTKALANLVKEREQTAMRLEKAECLLIKKVNIARNKHYRKHPATTAPPIDPSEIARQDLSSADSGVSSQKQDGPLRIDLPGPTLLSQTSLDKATNSESTAETVVQDDKDEKKDKELDYVHPYGLRPTLPDVRGSVAAQWIPAEDRPHHRPLGNFGRRVDTIRWTRNRLKELNLLIFKTRRQVRRGDSEALPAAFIEFDTQEAAQAAQQVVTHHLPLQMAPRLLGIRTDEVIWDSLRMSWWERIVRRVLILTLITAAVIFWSIPSAFIGLVSNIDFLSEKIPFLYWIPKLPNFIKGIIGGFVPPMVLSLLMALVPVLLRGKYGYNGIHSFIILSKFWSIGRC